MAQFNGISIDGVVYNVLIKYESIKRTFTLIEGKNQGTSLMYRRIRDLQGTGYSFVMEFEPNPTSPTDYDTLYEVLSAPTDYHTIIVPYGQTTKTINAYVSGGTDTFYGKVGGSNRWGGLQVTFTYYEPTRTQ